MRLRMIALQWSNTNLTPNIVATQPILNRSFEALFGSVFTITFVEVPDIVKIVRDGCVISFEPEAEVSLGIVS
jgi:hypothetical protein